MSEDEAVAPDATETLVVTGSKIECLCQISKDAIRDQAHLERRSYENAIRFRCKREGCSFSCICRIMRRRDDNGAGGENKNPEILDVNINPDVLHDNSYSSDDDVDYGDRWEVIARGVHKHPKDADGRDFFVGVPLREHVQVVTAQKAAGNKRGKALAEEVSTELTVPVRPHVTARLAKRLTCSEQAQCWYKMLPLLERLNENDFHTAVKTDGNDQSLVYCYVETCYAAHFLESQAFIGVLFLDGAHMSDIAKHTMLSVCTVTADKIILPLAMAVVDSENNESYKFFMQSMKDGAFSSCKQATIFADQHAAIKHALRTVFGVEDASDEDYSEEEDSSEEDSSVTESQSDESIEDSYDYLFMPCIWHLTKHMKGKEQFKQLVWTDHKLLYKARKAQYIKTHPSEYQRFKKDLHRMAYAAKNSKSERCFGYVADSPVESLNSLLRDERATEPAGLIEQFLEASLDRRKRQLEKLKDRESDCHTAMAREKRRREIAKTLAVTMKSQRSYDVTEIWTQTVAGRYNVQVNDKEIVSCSCREYERLGVACRHMHAVNQKYPGILPPVPRKCYHSATIREALGVDNNGVPLTFRLPNLTDLEPVEQPLHAPKQRPGRPKIKRFKSVIERYSGQEQLRRCSCCKKMCHHTRRTCPDRLAEAAEEATNPTPDDMGPGRCSQPKRTRRSPVPPTTIQTRSRSRSPAPMATRRSSFASRQRHGSPSRFSR